MKTVSLDLMHEDDENGERTCHHSFQYLVNWVCLTLDEGKREHPEASNRIDNLKRELRFMEENLKSSKAIPDLSGDDAPSNSASLSSSYSILDADMISKLRAAKDSNTEEEVIKKAAPTINHIVKEIIEKMQKASHGEILTHVTIYRSLYPKTADVLCRGLQWELRKVWNNASVTWETCTGYGSKEAITVRFDGEK